MLERILNSGTQTLLNRSLDAASLRNDVIANNIANVDTPGFKRSEVIFEDKIRNAMSDNNHDNARLNITNSRHIQIQGRSADLTPEIRTMNDLTYRNDGNNVDIDTESAKLAKNDVLYNALSQSISSEIKILRLAITGRR